MKKLYTPSEIESVVQHHWYENKTFSVTEYSDQEKYYCLSMIPYPSGNLHMGHVRNYTIGDVISRYQRMLGKNVLQPIGWDAFGLPAEHAAMINKMDPESWTYSNICSMKRQLRLLGFAYDWNREIITCHPEYYRWEQWLFIVLYERGLIYKKLTFVNWCPYHLTVLANEQVINNCCWRCQTRVQYKKMSQWFIKITMYADQLLQGLDTLKHWPEQVKVMQRNWIGRSVGMNVTFKVLDCDDVLSIYMTRLDIFMGITYVVVSIDHPITAKAAQFNIDVVNFVKSNDISCSDIDSKDFSYREQQGVFTNMYAIHPITHNILPIWIVNFFSSSFIELEGKESAIAAVPAHNQRDLDFARKYNLPVKQVIKNNDGTQDNICEKAMISDGILCNSNEFNGFHSNVANNMISKKLIKYGIAKYSIKYRLKDWNISRQRYWGVPIPMVTLEDGSVKPVAVENLPVTLPTKTLFTKNQLNNYINSSLKEYTDWIYTNYKGRIAIRDTDTFDTFMESSWYYARYSCPHYNKGMLNSCAANYWLPVDQYIGGIEHAVMHLLYFRFYHKLMRDIGLLSSDEPAVSLICQGMVVSDAFYYIADDNQRIWVNSTDAIVSRDKAGRIVKAIDKDGHNLIYTGTCKMSKSKNNGVDPSKIIKKYGADTVRFFIMFAAPITETLEWNESGLIGAQRFLKRVWNLVYEHVHNNGPIDNLCDDLSLNSAQKFIRFSIHKTIEKVTDDIDRRKSFNTALAAIMKLVNILNTAEKASGPDRAILQEALLVVVRLLYPFTPHISFVLWQALGGKQDIDCVSWPSIDASAIQNDRTFISVQVDGKMRHKIYVPWNSDKNFLYKILEEKGILDTILVTRKIINIVYIKNKAINIVTQ
ncbi:leucine--tRNA ligase [Candidatus Blochmannia ocreatus (nom. nud.)]|uniref:Leucine--tRNA ligase n=1 Tax=Candidatus Blochmannia ocreatus (nom. nud.) TaxID=251538 RepID=A0ABY4SV58_9ENTR|nr:leucine--tRNA ligase [Candidatus Blochmannia ocreatus]URJ25373.1 leucine--tRNA ligase [Candidatus Blochmannia ocreatus]